MKVTREVIYDLLPAYFAGDVSADTRALVEEYFATDPEFGRMATRFQGLIAEGQRAKNTGVTGEAAETDRERAAFQRARAAAELPQKARAQALAFGFASLFSFGIAFLTWNARMGLLNPGILLGGVFGVTAVVVFALSFRIRPDSYWCRNLMGLDDKSLKS
jgi:anti-sigma factor RsiW